MRSLARPALTVIATIALAAGCAKLEHVSDIGSESEAIVFCVYVERDQATLRAGSLDIVPGQNRVLVGYWLRPGGRPGYQFRDELRIEYRAHTGEVVGGVWDSTYYTSHGTNPPESDHASNQILSADDSAPGTSEIVYPATDGGTGWMRLVLATEWWRTSRVVTVQFRKNTVPSRFPYQG